MMDLLINNLKANLAEKVYVKCEFPDECITLSIENNL